MATTKKKKTGKASASNPYGVADTSKIDSKTGVADNGFTTKTSSSSSKSSSSSGKSTAVSVGSGTYDSSRPQGAQFNGAYDDVADRPLDDYYYAKESYYKDMYETARQNGDVEGMRAANDGMNQIRNDYGLAAERAEGDINYIKGQTGYYGNKGGGGGGGSGGGISYPEFSYGNAPEFVSQWAGIIQDLADQILNRDPFSYDYTQDPLYDQYKEVYTREGDRAMQDTLGAVSARTGGLASSYATSAANQANNYYMSQLSDKIPELQQLAYSMYQDQGNQLMNMLDMVMSLENGDYAKFQDQLNQWNTDRNFAYGAMQDQLANDRYDREWAYQLQQDQYSNDLDMAALLASVGDYSGYANLWGLSEAQTQALIDQYAKNQSLSDKESAMALADWMAQKGDFSGLRDLGIDTSYLDAKQRAELAGLSSGGSGSSGGGRGSSSGTGDEINEQDYNALFEAAMDSGHAKSFIANNYKNFGFTSSSGLYDDYLDWVDVVNEKSNSDSGLQTLQEQLLIVEDSSNPNVVPQKAASLIEGYYNRGSITEETAKKLLRQYGFDV